MNLEMDNIKIVKDVCKHMGFKVMNNLDMAHGEVMNWLRSGVITGFRVEGNIKALEITVPSILETAGNYVLFIVGDIALVTTEVT